MGVSLRVGPLRFYSHSRRGDFAGLVSGFCELLFVTGKFIYELRKLGRDTIKDPESSRNERILGHCMFWPCQLFFWGFIAACVFSITAMTYGVGTLVGVVLVALMIRHGRAVTRAQGPEAAPALETASAESGTVMNAGEASAAEAVPSILAVLPPPTGPQLPAPADSPELEQAPYPDPWHTVLDFFADS